MFKFLGQVLRCRRHCLCKSPPPKKDLNRGERSLDKLLIAVQRALCDVDSLLAILIHVCILPNLNSPCLEQAHEIPGFAAKPLDHTILGREKIAGLVQCTKIFTSRCDLGQGQQQSLRRRKLHSCPWLKRSSTCREVARNFRILKRRSGIFSLTSSARATPSSR